MEIKTGRRVKTGLERLDSLLGGGLPPRSLVVVAGVPGSSKSVLAFHMLAQAVLEGGSAMPVTTTHQPVSKMRSQYSSLTFLGPTGVFDELDVLVGEYSLPRDLDLPELAMADLVIYLEVERLVASNLRTLRIYKMRGQNGHRGAMGFPRKRRWHPIPEQPQRAAGSGLARYHRVHLAAGVNPRDKPSRRTHCHF